MSSSRLLSRGVTLCELEHSRAQSLWAALSREDFFGSQFFSSGTGLPPARTFSSVAEKTNQRRHGSYRTVRDISELFVFNKKLGAGGFAEVWLGRSRGNNRNYACKSISKTLIDQHGAGGLRAVTCEIENHLTVVSGQRGGKNYLNGAVPSLRPQHSQQTQRATSNVVTMHMVVEDDQHIHLIMDACAGGSLMEAVHERAFTGPDMCERESRDLVKAAALAVRQCHEKYICHRDIKPDNFAFGLESCRPDSLRLLDFGLSRSFEDGARFQGQAGSPWYMAPEVCANNTGEYDERCDAWSMGILSYFILTGRVPFRGKTRSQIFANVQQQALPCAPLLQSPACSPAAKDFVESLLVKDPAGRMTVEEALQHDWMMAEAIP